MFTTGILALLVAVIMRFTLEMGFLSENAIHFDKCKRARGL